MALEIIWREYSFSLRPGVNLKEWFQLLRASKFRKRLYPLYAILALLKDSPAMVQARFDREFDVEDPWDFSAPAEQERHRQALAMIDLVKPVAGFGRVLEIGCAEGMFSCLLASRSNSLVAADVSPVALERARRGCQGFSNIEFLRLNLRSDDLPGRFDLIVAMDVLYYIRRPWDLRLACNKMVQALHPRGYILLEHTRDLELEGSWWSRPFLFGASQIESLFEKHPGLKLVSRRVEAGNLFALFQQKS